jgi:beta-glucanase (GH16 family)
LVAALAQAHGSNVSVSRSTLGGVYAPGDLIWQDEFDSLNLNVWHHEVQMNGGGNGEFQVYDKDPENSYVRDGVLYIKPTLTLDKFNGNYEQLYNGNIKLEGCTDPPGQDCERQGYYPYILPPAYSARLRTAGSFSFRYGRVQVRARMPAGDWTWPAIWMLPESWVYGGWPASGEIDIVESRGNRNLFNGGNVNIGSEQMGSTLHFGPFWPHNGYWAAHGERNTVPGYDADFHIYETEWTPSYIKFIVDGNEIKTVTPPGGGFFELGQFPGDVPNPWAGAENFRMAPFDQNFHFILNVAVGGAFFPGDSRPPPPWGGATNFLDFMNAVDSWRGTWNGENHAMAVDWIRVYAV